MNTIPTFFCKWCLFLVLAVISFSSLATPQPAREIFTLSAEVKDPNALKLTWQIKPGFFLYKNRIHLKAINEADFKIGNIHYPKALIKKDRLGHDIPIYRKVLDLPIAILGTEPGEALLTVLYQGCSDDGFCYPPQNKTIKLSFNQELALTKAILESTEETSPKPMQSSIDDEETNDFFAYDNIFMILFSFLGFGLLLAFTPCVLPMVPVLSGLIIGHGHAISTRKAFFLSLSYVLSMAFTYAVFGSIVALLGSNLQLMMQSPPVIILFSLIFILLALSMFNFYEIRLPLSWQNKLASYTRNQAGGHYVSAVVMGSLSTLILSPCVTAPLVGALSYIAHTGNVLLGAMALFSLGLGMGLPLLLIGTSAGKLLPKAGHWMNGVKSFFGILLLAVAIYLLDRVLPASITMLLWSSLLVFSGIYAGALVRATNSLEKFCQGLGILTFIYGILILIGASMGNNNPLQPLAITTVANKDNLNNPEKIVHSLAEVKNSLANAQGKPVLLDFYADWCASCKILEATIFKNPQIQAILNDFIVLKLDITANNKQSKALLNYFNVIAPPTFLFFNSQGKEIKQLRLVGEVSNKELLIHLKQTKKTGYHELNKGFKTILP